MKLKSVIRVLPFLLPVLSIVVYAIVYIRLGCMPGTGCGNVSQVEYHRTAFQEFMNLWEIG